MSALFVLSFFTDIKTFNRSVIAHNSGVNQTFGSFFSVYKQGFSGLCFHNYLYLRFLVSLRRILDKIRVRRLNSRVLGKR